LAVIALAVFGWLYWASGKAFNVLILGVDGEGKQTRTDILVLARYEPRQNVLSLVSIPRDTRASIPGREKPEKIGHANAYGGPKLTVKTVEKLLGVKVPYYVRVDFRAFADLVNAVGGVEINVEKAMNYEDNSQDLHIHLKPGKQILDGDKALQYVRFRNDGQGDIGRIKRVQKFLLALIEGQKKAGVGNLRSLVATGMKYVDTNLSAPQALALAKEARNLDEMVILTASLPGKSIGLKEGGQNVYYWEIDKEAAAQVVEKYITNPEPNPDPPQPDQKGGK
jgi:LCP family protein required for cell wall assembly